MDVSAFEILRLGLQSAGLPVNRYVDRPWMRDMVAAQIDGNYDALHAGYMPVRCRFNADHVLTPISRCKCNCVVSYA